MQIESETARKSALMKMLQLKYVRLDNDQGNIEKMRKMDKPGEVYQLIVEILTEY